MQKKEEIPYIQEVLRKSIHLSSLTIPIVYSFISKPVGLMILIPLTLFALIMDLARHFSPPVRSFFTRYFGGMMRIHELDTSRLLLNGATYVLMSACLCVLIFPKIIAITAFTILIISDVAAALIGRRWGKKPFLDKSAVGTSAFIISGILVVLWITVITHAPWVYAVIGSIGAVIGGIVEAGSIRLRMDDNFSIPISIGLTMWGLLLLTDPMIKNTILTLLILR